MGGCGVSDSGKVLVIVGGCGVSGSGKVWS